MKLARLLIGFALTLVVAATAPAQSGRDLRLALTGDSILTQRLSVYEEPEYLRLVALIRDADAAFTNCEMLFHNYEAPAAPLSGGTWMAAPPGLARELAWMGFDLVSTANNHAFDYGAEGLANTLKALAAAGLAAAGTGENLARARAPAYFETRNGCVALVAAASTFPAIAPAGEQRQDLRGRPGVSPLRHGAIYYLDAENFAALAGLKRALGMNDEGETADRLEFLGEEFRLGEPPRVETRADTDDLAEIAAAVREARRQADWVIVSLHAHESGESHELPADFVVAFARAMVEAGADVVVGHGPHRLRGIEIYKGRPIFYSLGNFVFQNETVAFLPAEMYRQYGLESHRGPADLYDARTENDRVGFPAHPVYWESVAAEVLFAGGRLEEVRLYPIVLGHGQPRPQRGRPVLATGAQGEEILGRLAELSKPFGTAVDVRDGVGRVRLPSR